MFLDRPVTPDLAYGFCLGAAAASPVDLIDVEAVAFSTNDEASHAAGKRLSGYVLSRMWSSRCVYAHAWRIAGATDTLQAVVADRIGARFEHMKRLSLREVARRLVEAEQRGAQHAD